MLLIAVLIISSTNLTSSSSFSSEVFFTYRDSNVRFAISSFDDVNFSNCYVFIAYDSFIIGADMADRPEKFPFLSFIVLCSSLVTLV